MTSTFTSHIADIHTTAHATYSMVDATGEIIYNLLLWLITLHRVERVEDLPIVVPSISNSLYSCALPWTERNPTRKVDFFIAPT